MVANTPGVEPPRYAPDALDTRLRTLNEERAIFILRALLASEKISKNAVIAAIELANALRIGND